MRTLLFLLLVLVLASCARTNYVYIPEQKNGLTVLEYVKPCGDEFPNDEIFLRMSDNKIVALFDGGEGATRLVLLAPGNYVTTDRSGSSRCYFTIDENNQIINQEVK